MSVSALRGDWPAESFAGQLDIAELSAVMRLGRSAHYTAAEYLMREGETGEFAIIIRRGQVKVVISDGAGRDHLLGVAGPGDLLGEMSCMDGKARSASVVALGDIHCTWFSAPEFRGVVASSAAVACAVARLAADRLRAAHRLRVEVGAHDVATRLVRILRDVGRVFDHAPRRPGYTVPLSQAELGQLVNASEVSVQRALRHLRRQRLLSTGYRVIHVPCADCLDAYAEVARTTDALGAKAVTGCGGAMRHPRS